MRTGSSEGHAAEFDLIILAGGFGLELAEKPFVTNSYWRNEQIAQPILNGTRQSYVVSGYGDGALVDLCRLSIARFRQDSVLYELFGKREIEGEEAAIREKRESVLAGANATFEFFSELTNSMLETQMELLATDCVPTPR